MATHKNRPSQGSARYVDLADEGYWRNWTEFRVLNALLYLGLARAAADDDDFERACRGYRRSLDAWHSANSHGGHRWCEEQAMTNQEYADFLLGGRSGQA